MWWHGQHTKAVRQFLFITSKGFNSHKWCRTVFLNTGLFRFYDGDRICSTTFRQHAGDPVRSSSRQISLPVKTTICWLVPISSLFDGDVHSERPGYLFGYLSYVNSLLWVMAQQLLPPSCARMVAYVKNNRLISRLWSVGRDTDSVIALLRQRGKGKFQGATFFTSAHLSTARRCKKGL